MAVKKARMEHEYRMRIQPDRMNRMSEVRTESAVWRCRDGTTPWPLRGKEKGKGREGKRRREGKAFPLL